MRSSIILASSRFRLPNYLVALDQGHFHGLEAPLYAAGPIIAPLFAIPSVDSSMLLIATDDIRYSCMSSNRSLYTSLPATVSASNSKTGSIVYIVAPDFDSSAVSYSITPAFVDPFLAATFVNPFLTAVFDDLVLIFKASMFPSSKVMAQIFLNIFNSDKTCCLILSEVLIYGV